MGTGDSQKLNDHSVNGVRACRLLVASVSGLAEQGGVPLWVKPNDEGVTHPQCGRAEGTAPAENDLGQIVVTDPIGQVELQQLLALRDPHSAALSGEIQGFFPMDLDLVGDDEFGLLDVLGSQELLGTGARSSTLAVVVPLDGFGHGVSSGCGG